MILNFQALFFEMTMLSDTFQDKIYFCFFQKKKMLRKSKNNLNISTGNSADNLQTVDK